MLFFHFKIDAIYCFLSKRGRNEMILCESSNVNEKNEKKIQNVNFCCLLVSNREIPIK